MVRIAGKTFFYFILGTAMLYVLLLFGLSYETTYVPPGYSVSYSQLPELQSKSWGVFDAETGEVLVTHNATSVQPIASVTKLMTAEVVLEELNTANTTFVSWDAVRTEGRAGRLQAGDEMLVRELLFPLVLESSNDAAEVLAEHEGRAAFMTAMNTRAVTLGMKDTRFDDPSGLSEKNVSTVVDIAKLATHIYVNRRHIFDISRLTQYVSSEDQIWINNNPVFASGGYLGGKHGFTPEAGRTLAGVFLDTVQGGVERPIGIVLLDSDDLEADTERLRRFVRQSVAYE